MIKEAQGYGIDTQFKVLNINIHLFQNWSFFKFKALGAAEEPL